MQARRAIIAVLSTATFVAAQDATTAPAKNSKPAPLRESILNSDQARMSWEASQTWSIPALREASPTEGHTVRIEETNQPAPSLPKLRREWLTPSDESPKMVSEK